jgi:hypothetical protein
MVMTNRSSGQPLLVTNLSQVAAYSVPATKVVATATKSAHAD